MEWSNLMFLSLAGLPLGYLLAQRWSALCRSGAARHAEPAAVFPATQPRSPGLPSPAVEPAVSLPPEAGLSLPPGSDGGDELPLPSVYLARWTIDYDSGDAWVRTRTVRVLRVHPRLRCLMCYCEDTHHIRTFAWDGLRAVREPDGGRPVNFDTWVLEWAADAEQPATAGR
jgi:hypothetical protein